MFWLIGGRELVWGLCLLILGFVPAPIGYHLSHPTWIGFSFWDWIMPLFVFLAGAALPFSLTPSGTATDRRKYYVRIVRRVGLLWILGLLYEGSLGVALFSGSIHDIELFSSTLQAIAAAYCVTALAMLHLSRRRQLLLAMVCLLVNSSVISLFPFGGMPAGTLSPQVNASAFIDTLVLGQFDDDTTFTWVLSILGCIATMVFGSCAGHMLRTTDGMGTVRLLLATGATLLIAGLLLTFAEPLIRRIWTTSLVLVSSGLSFWSLSFFYYFLDIRKQRKWAFPFVVIGANSIVAYMLGEQWVQTWTRLLGEYLAPELGELLGAIIAFLTLWGLLALMFRHRYFVRV